MYTPVDVWNRIDVVTPPIQAYGKRKQNLYEPPLMKFAMSNSIEVTTVPEEGIRSWLLPQHYQTPSPTNILLTASFGHILPSSHLQMFESNRALNVHPSLLPKYRGASPIQYALMNQDEITGVSIQNLSDRGADTGALYKQQEFAIPPNSTFETLLSPLATLGGELLVQTLEGLLAGTLESIPQTEVGKSRARKISHELGALNWNKLNASMVYARYRAISHQQSLHTFLPPAPLTPSSHSSDVILTGLFDISLPPAPVPFPTKSSQQPSSKTDLLPGQTFYSKAQNALVVQTVSGQVLVGSVHVAKRSNRVDARQAWLGWKDQGRITDGFVQFVSPPGSE
ncbi:methionyl-trna formyltransferase [Phaffia rhodozyma]|uniref:methionyl-tRNA formyltransferase n=1 Tax=Phaffia rhodozyma TaxID=264483 RepID=A0A0F7SKK1_PHARH|nr:methionyl-trna formyltransferase [Phaffia rhodozyma]